MERGRLIVFDGGDGAGKGTVLKSLQEYFPEPKTLFTREPGGTPLSDKIRDVILSDLASDASAETLLALYFASRSDHVEKKIEPALASGINVITDRYDSSSAAYQLRAMEGVHLRHLFNQMRGLYCRRAIPYLYVYIDIDPLEGMRRVKGRTDENHLDRRQLDFHAAVRAGYLDFLSCYPHRIVDGGQSQEAVFQECLKIVHNALD